MDPDHTSLPSVSNTLAKWQNLADENNENTNEKRQAPNFMRSYTTPIRAWNNEESGSPLHALVHASTLPIPDPEPISQTNLNTKNVLNNGVAYNVNSISHQNLSGYFNIQSGLSSDSAAGIISPKPKKAPPIAPPKPARLSHALTNLSLNEPDESDVKDSTKTVQTSIPVNGDLGVPVPMPPSESPVPISSTGSLDSGNLAIRVPQIVAPTASWPNMVPSYGQDSELAARPQTPSGQTPTQSPSRSPVPPPSRAFGTPISPSLIGDSGQTSGSFTVIPHAAESDEETEETLPQRSKPPVLPQVMVVDNEYIGAPLTSPVGHNRAHSVVVTPSSLMAPPPPPPSRRSVIIPESAWMPPPQAPLQRASSTITPPSLPPRPTMTPPITTLPIPLNVTTSPCMTLPASVMANPVSSISSGLSSNNTSVTLLHSVESDTELLDNGTVDDMAAVVQEDLSDSYPDSSQTNRRAPVFEGVMHEVPVKGEAKIMAVHGEHACIAIGTTLVLYNIVDGNKVWAHSLANELKITAIGFIPEGDQPKQIWIGSKEGMLMAMDINDPGNCKQRKNIHMQAVVYIGLRDDVVWTLSDDGKICLWSNCDILSVPKPFRVTPNFKAFAIGVGNTLWVGKNRQVFVYQPSLSTNTSFLLTPRPLVAATAGNKSTATEFSCGTAVESIPDYLFFGHEGGTVTVYSQSRMAVVCCVNVSIHKLTSIRGVGGNLWIGLKTGAVMVCDVSQFPWRILKEWKPHDTPVSQLTCGSGQREGHNDVLAVGSLSGTKVLFWDGLLKRDWIEHDMQSHDADFSSFNDIVVKIVTWNAGAAKPTDLDNSAADREFLHNALKCPDGAPDIIVFGFQELVELDNRAVTAKTMFLNKKKDAGKKVSTSSHISPQYKDWQECLHTAIAGEFSERYQMTQSSNMVGLFTCVFMKEDLSSMRLRGTRSSEIKTGLGGLHGNKGALVVRVIVDDSSICFVNCHLAAGQTGTLHRNKDIETILETQFLEESDNTKYTTKGIFVNGGDGTKILDHETVFMAGDMNYRINLMRPIVMKALKEESFASLLESDQLRMQLKRNPGLRLRQFQESEVTFAPTYKFDIGSDNYDSSEKKRVPAWCDRIFFRGGSRVTAQDYNSVVCRVSDHRPVVGLYRVKVKTIDALKRGQVYRECLERWAQRNPGV